MVARETRVTTLVDPAQQVVQMSATSRMAEMRGELETQMASFVEQKLAVAHSRIEELSQSIVEAKQQAARATNQMQAELGQMREEQVFTAKKIQEVEQSVVSQGASMIQQMGTMLQTMQSNLEQSMAQQFQQHACQDFDPEKRARIDTTAAKQDPFSTRN